MCSAASKPLSISSGWHGRRPQTPWVGRWRCEWDVLQNANHGTRNSSNPQEHNRPPTFPCLRVNSRVFSIVVWVCSILHLWTWFKSHFSGLQGPKYSAFLPSQCGQSLCRQPGGHTLEHRCRDLASGAPLGILISWCFSAKFRHIEAFPAESSLSQGVDQRWRDRSMISKDPSSLQMLLLAILVAFEGPKHSINDDQ